MGAVAGHGLEETRQDTREETREETRKAGRRRAVDGHKRRLILDAARAAFAQDGLDGASLRAIAGRAGYTPAALYFHFPSKEALYAEVLHASLASLGAAVHAGVAGQSEPGARLHGAALAFFHFYARNPRDLDLGFYLLRGGMKPAGLGRERDEALNAALADALRPIAEAAEALGAPRAEADLVMVDTFAHATGLLLLLHTGRIRMFGANATERMEGYVRTRIAALRDHSR